ncbi:MAG: hypothetical protein ACRDHV_12125 [Actinomycetota bacterium]
MENLVTIYRLTWRWVAVAVIAAVAGAVLIAPTVSQAAAFLTKQKANKLYLGNTTVVSSSTTLAPDQGATVTVLCPPGFQAIDGGGLGGSYDTATGEAVLQLESYPVAAGSRPVGWTVEYANTTSNPVQVDAQAVCSK